MSKPSTPPDSTGKPLPKKKRSRFRALRLAFLLLLLTFVALLDPHIFCGTLKVVLRAEAWRRGAELTLHKIEGSAFSPIVFSGAELKYLSQKGAVTRTKIAHAEAQIDFKDFLHGNFQNWFKLIKFNGVDTHVSLPQNAPAPAVAPLFDWARLLKPQGRWLPNPERIEAGEVNLSIENDSHFVRLERVQLVVNQLDKGSISIGRLTIKQPWLEHTFRDVRGTTVLQDSKLQDSKFLIANLKLEPGIEILSVSSQLADLANGEFNAAITMAAFDGEIKADARISPDLKPLSFEVGGQITKVISIAKLANFLALSDAAGGTIKDGGTFSFRGAPQQLDKATASMWLEAKNFQWESRQWDSLAFGASIMNRRMQVSKLDLIQGHNRLNLNGEMTLPSAGVKWWQSDFTCNLSAKIADLTELSALMLPEFKFAAGQADIDGSIRGRKLQFDGQLVISGSHLKWRNAPIENLNAALKLDGNECKISHLSIINNGDYVRGYGVVNILGATQYWGEFRASIADLATYSAILQKPIVPEPLAGRAILEWSGEGSANGHSGKFLANLNKVRFLGALASQLHPINIDLDGNYSKGGVQFGKFALSDDASSFSANVGVGNNALSVQRIRLAHGAQVVLSGDALLPLDVWQAWPNTSPATLLNADTVSDLHLEANGLDLHRASQLVGWNFPISGTLTGNLNASGPISSLKTSGKLVLTRSNLPLGWSGDALSDVEASANFQGAELSLEKFTAKHRVGDLSVTGSIGLLNLLAPTLKLHLQSPNATLPISLQIDSPEAPAKGSGPSVSAQLDLQIEGPANAAHVQGQAQLRAVDLAGGPDLSALWKENANIELRPLLGTQPGLLAPWTLDINCQTPAPITPAAAAKQGGTLSVNLHLGGTGSAPSLDGSVEATKIAASAGSQAITVESAALTLKRDRPRNPTLDLQASGRMFDQAFNAQVVGPLSHLIRWFTLTQPLNDELLMETLGGKKAAPAEAALLAPPDLSILVPEGVTNGITPEIWAPIPTPADTTQPSPAAPQPPTGASSEAATTPIP